MPKTKLKIETASPNGSASCSPNELEFLQQQRQESFAVTRADIHKVIEEIRLRTIEGMARQGHLDPGLWWGYLEPKDRGFITALYWVLGEDPAGTYGSASRQKGIK